MDRRPQATDYDRRAAAPARPLHLWEQELLRVLASASGLPEELTDPQALTGYRVKDMLDGGMGSIRFVLQVEGQAVRFGVSERWYRDADGTRVSFALNLNEEGRPYEIDAWKVDSSPLLRPPTASELRVSSLI
jgi:hypothetical protein